MWSCALIFIYLETNNFVVQDNVFSEIYRKIVQKEAQKCSFLCRTGRTESVHHGSNGRTSPLNIWRQETLEIPQPKKEEEPPVVCASLWLPGIPGTPSFPEEQPSLGTARVINKSLIRFWQRSSCGNTKQPHYSFILQNLQLFWGSADPEQAGSGCHNKH